MKTIVNEKVPAVKVKRAAIRASAILAAPTEKGQLISPKEAMMLPITKPAAATKAKAATTLPKTVEGSAKAKPAARAGNGKAASEKTAKIKDAKKKNKVVRDSFTMPEDDYIKLAALKARCLAAGIHVKKSELLRAGLQVLETLPAKKMLAIVAGIENVKTGRPAKI